MYYKRINSGTDLWHALHVARKLGCTIADKRGTGERVISHPSMSDRICVDARRKDCPRALSVWLNKLIALIRVN